ncbi:MAG: UbiA family prenyltransferase [Candidatus Micrarchaeota archaeon]
MKLNAFLRLTRFEHSLMLVLATLVGQTMALGGLPGIEIALLASVPPFAIGLASFAVNDFFDVETDRKNKRLDRPIVSGEVRHAEAYYLSIALFLAGVMVSFYLPNECTVIAAGFAMVAYLYSLKLKDYPLAGNIYIAGTMAIPFVYGNYSVGKELLPAVLVLSLIAFTAGVAREIAGSVRDMDGDKARNSRTIPVVIGRRNSILLHAGLYVLAVLLSFYPYFYIQGFMGNFVYLALIGATDLLVLYAAIPPLLDDSVRVLRRSRNVSLAALGTGLVGFLAGALKVFSP